MATEAGVKGHWNMTKKKDLIKFLLNNKDQKNETNYFSLIDMARKRKIKNFAILTKYTLEKALGLETTHDKPCSKPLIFVSENDRFEFATQKEAMDSLSVSVSRIAEAIKNGKINVNNVEYKF